MSEKAKEKDVKLVRLGDFARTEKGKKPKNISKVKTEKFSIPYVNIKAFEKNIIDEYTDGEGCVICEDGDFLMVWDGSRSGYVGKAIKGALGSTLVRISLPDVNHNYAYYFLQSKFIEINTRAKGVGIPHVDPSIVWNYNFPLPSKEVQETTVSKIEELLSELDKGIEELIKTQQQLKTYRQAVLKWAFEGRFTNKHIKEGELPKGWKVISVGSICESIVPNRDKPKSFTGDIKWVTIPNLSETNIRLDYNNIKMGLSQNEVQLYNARVIPINSVIMTCVGTFGLSAIVEKPIVINQQLHAFVSNDLINPKFLAYCIQHNKRYFRSKSTSTTIQYLNKENCNSMPFPICSVEEQNQIVKELETRLSVCDKIEETITNSLQQSEALRQSILNKAFEGELIP
jgi:type I restriction enzyme, S subunit